MSNFPWNNTEAWRRGPPTPNIRGSTKRKAGDVVDLTVERDPLTRSHKVGVINYATHVEGVVESGGQYFAFESFPDGGAKQIRNITPDIDRMKAGNWKHPLWGKANLRLYEVSGPSVRAPDIETLRNCAYGLDNFSCPIGSARNIMQQTNDLITKQHLIDMHGGDDAKVSNYMFQSAPQRMKTITGLMRRKYGETADVTELGKNPDDEGYWNVAPPQIYGGFVDMTGD